jgi:hypothetical protein
MGLLPYFSEYNKVSCFASILNMLRPIHITRARQACAHRETHLAFTCARKSASTLLQLLTRQTPLMYRQQAEPHEPVACAARITCLVTCHIIHITREHSESHKHE